MPGAIAKAELQVLHYVHDHHPVTVREVAEHFSRTQGHVRTTTLNLMSRLVRKGHLTRRKVDDVYQYSPRVSKPQLMRSLVQDFVQKALGGSVSPFVAYLAEDAALSDEERRALKKIVQQLDAARKEEGR